MIKKVKCIFCGETIFECFYEGESQFCELYEGYIIKHTCSIKSIEEKSDNDD